ncbi:MAG: pyrimidine 5'-nucleotidase, partial [Rhodospirillales bacterium]
MSVTEIETWVFDLDNTLYPASCNLFAGVDVRIREFVADFLGLEQDEAYKVQKQFFKEYGTTLRGLMDVHGMAPKEYLDYVHAIDLSPVVANPELDKALAALPGRKIIFTNGDTPHAERVMDRLGVKQHFEPVFDIVAAGYVPKPNPSV